MPHNLKRYNKSWEESGNGILSKCNFYMYNGGKIFQADRTHRRDLSIHLRTKKHTEKEYNQLKSGC